MNVVFLLMGILLLAPLTGHTENCDLLFHKDTSLSKSMRLTFADQSISEMTPLRSTTEISLSAFRKTIRGHFPENPIIPGALTQELFYKAALQLAEKSLNFKDVQLKSIMQLGFSKGLTPDDKVEIVTEIQRLHLDRAEETLEATIHAKILHEGVVTAESKFIIAKEKNEPEPPESEVEQVPAKINTSITHILPQKFEILLTDGINYSTELKSSISAEDITPLKGRITQTFYKVPSNHSFLLPPVNGEKASFPKSLNLEVMAQSAISNLAEVLPDNKFNVLLVSVKKAHFFEPMYADNEYRIQSHILKVMKRKQTDGTYLFLSNFKASITHKGKLISEAMLTGIVTID